MTLAKQCFPLVRRAPRSTNQGPPQPLHDPLKRAFVWWHLGVVASDPHQPLRIQTSMRFRSRPLTEPAKGEPVTKACSAHIKSREVPTGMDPLQGIIAKIPKSQTLDGDSGLSGRNAISLHKFPHVPHGSYMGRLM